MCLSLIGICEKVSNQRARDKYRKCDCDCCLWINWVQHIISGGEMYAIHFGKNVLVLGLWHGIAQIFWTPFKKHFFFFFRFCLMTVRTSIHWIKRCQMKNFPILKMIFPCQKSKDTMEHTHTHAHTISYWLNYTLHELRQQWHFKMNSLLLIWFSWRNVIKFLLLKLIIKFRCCNSHLKIWFSFFLEMLKWQKDNLKVYYDQVFDLSKLFRPTFPHFFYAWWRIRSQWKVFDIKLLLDFNQILSTMSWSGTPIKRKKTRKYHHNEVFMKQK